MNSDAKAQKRESCRKRGFNEKVRKKKRGRRQGTAVKGVGGNVKLPADRKKRKGGEPVGGRGFGIGEKMPTWKRGGWLRGWTGGDVGGG